MSARRIRAIDARLNVAYGRRGWWPLLPRGGGAPVYDPALPYRRKTDAEVVEIAVGAVLAQNTAWTNAVTALMALRDAGGLQVEALCSVPLARLEQTIRSSGYFRAKARKLRALGRFLRAQPVAALRRRETGPLRAALLCVHGIGPETADDILCHALDRPVAIADAYARRILGRTGATPVGSSYEPVRHAIEEALPPEAARLNEFHARLVELAKTHCRKTPVCRGCPIRVNCAQDMS